MTKEVAINDKVNPLFYHILDLFNNPEIRFIWIYGGSSAAKTFSAVQTVLFNTLADNSSTMVLRKFGADLKDSIYSDFKGQVYDYELRQAYEPQLNLIKGPADNVIRFRGLDDSEKIKGIARFKRVLMDELTQFDHRDLKQIRKRLRGLEGQQIIGLWNPIDENHWIKKEMLDVQQWRELPKKIDGYKYSELSKESFKKINSEGNAVLIKTTYLDNYWVVGHPDREDIGFKDVHTVKDFEHDRKHDFEYYKIYALGEWGKIDVGGECYKQFNLARHTIKREYDPGRAIWLSWDENVNPYLPLTIWQCDSANKEIWQIDEITMETPKNTVFDAVAEFCRRYPNDGNRVNITGDRTSKKGDVKLEKGHNLFTIIEEELKNRGYNNIRTHLPSRNPSVTARMNFINEAWREGGRVDWSIYLGEDCKQTIYDVRYVKEDKDGGKSKAMKRNPDTGVSYQEFGHLSDTMEYLVCEVAAEDYQKYINPNAGKINFVPRAISSQRW